MTQLAPLVFVLRHLKKGGTMARYIVNPFSGKNYHRNESRCPDPMLPCGICGKPIDPQKAKHWAVVIDGGARWGDMKSDMEDPGYMGEWPIGNDCHKKYVDYAL